MYNLRRERLGFEPCLGPNVGVSATPMLPEANLRFQEADFRIWTKEDAASPFYPRSFDRAAETGQQASHDIQGPT